MKNIPFHIKIIQLPITKPLGGSVALELVETSKKTKNQKFQKFQNAKFIEKLQKTCDIKKLKTIPRPTKIFQ